MMNRDPRQLRIQTRIYLQRLLEDREAESMRHKDLGTMDPMKVSTGQSALDAAVSQAEELIRSLDRILDKECPEVNTFRTTCNGLSRLKTSKCA
tara:strand:+ start:989 stop:1270 length:282 start_codon:yes stop_codon:yes gene_type:complete